MNDISQNGNKQLYVEWLNVLPEQMQGTQEPKSEEPRVPIAKQPLIE